MYNEKLTLKPLAIDITPPVEILSGTEKNTRQKIDMPRSSLESQTSHFHNNCNKNLKIIHTTPFLLLTLFI